MLKSKQFLKGKSNYISQITIPNKIYIRGKVKWVDDVSKMNSSRVNQIIYPHSEENIKDAIKKANLTGEKISIKGQNQSHTMGGQTITQGTVLDMTFFNRIIDFDKEKNIITVQPGISWESLIRFLNYHKLSPMILQSYANFSVGGTASANAHGITSEESLQNSIVEIEIINNEGKTIRCSREQNSELFSLALGGYSLLGVITKIKLKVVPNVPLKMKASYHKMNEFPREFKETMGKNIEIKLGRVNSKFDKIAFYKFFKNGSTSIISNLNETPKVSKTKLLMYKWFPTICTYFPSWQELRWKIEKSIGKPLDWASDSERNKLLIEKTHSISQLYNPLINLDRTHILQEYFIPYDKFDEWTLFLKNFFGKEKFKHVILLNTTVRFVNEDDTTFLKYAKTKNGMFAFVMYYRLPRNVDADKELEKINMELIDQTLDLGGTFYLPYRPHYTDKQLEKAYPEFKKFLQLKKSYDKEEMFSNMWYEHYKGKIALSPNNEFETKIIFDSPQEKLEQSQQSQSQSQFPEEVLKNQTYQKIFCSGSDSDILEYKFKTFLENIFYMLPPDELYSFIKGIMKENPNLSDLEVFNKIQKNINEKSLITNLCYKLRALKLLSEQRKDFVNQVINLKGHFKNDNLEGIVSIGDSKCVKKLKEKLKIKGPSYIVNDKESAKDIIERGSLFPVGKFVKLDYEKVNELEIPDESISLATCFMGLHHFPVDKLPQFLKSVHRILKNDGVFIIREHNAYPELMTIAHGAHKCFNAVTGVSQEEEEKEIRAFRTLDDWKKLLKKNGFEDMGVYEIQQNDTTDDYMMCLKKIIPEETKNKEILKEYADENKISYKRDLSRTYQTLVEWYLVDLTKQFGNFMDHTPYFSFPYLQKVGQMWKLFFKESEIVRKKAGFIKAYLSPDIISYMAMCGTTSVMFGLMSVLSYLPRKIFTLPFILADKDIKMIISYQKEIDPSHCDNRIIFDKTTEGNEKSTSLITIPRYKEFKDIVIKLAKNNVKFEEIAGQKQIQMKIKVNRLSDLDDIKIKGYKVLLNYKILETSVHEVALDVDICELANIIKTFEEKNIIIDHIFDF